VRTQSPTQADYRDQPALGFRMEAIKKKMQAMKVEKDNLCDRCDEVEQVRSRQVVFTMVITTRVCAENQGGLHQAGEG